MRYLLDEQSKIQGYHGDATNPLWIASRHVLQQHGGDGLQPTIADIQRLREEVKQEFRTFSKQQERLIGQQFDEIRSMLRDIKTFEPSGDLQSESRVSTILGTTSQNCTKRNLYTDRSIHLLQAEELLKTLLARVETLSGSQQVPMLQQPAPSTSFTMPPSLSLNTANPVQSGHLAPTSAPFYPPRNTASGSTRMVVDHSNRDDCLRFKVSGEVIMGKRPMNLPRVTTIREALLQWFEAGTGDKRQHQYALMEWPDEWVTKPITKEDTAMQVLHGQRKLLASAYTQTTGLEICTEAGIALFELQYPQGTLTKVMKAVREHMKEAGLLQSRKRTIRGNSNDVDMD